MGEVNNAIFNIGSPDIDIMFSDSLPLLHTVKNYYEIGFDNFGIVMFHPVTTEVKDMALYAINFVNALLDDNHNFVVIFPNNDLGSKTILEAYLLLKNNPRFRIIPSLRFEYFLTLLKNAQFIIGNSSAGIREAPYYGIPIINIGTRQQNRSLQSDIVNVGYEKKAISDALLHIDAHKAQNVTIDFGNGNSTEMFVDVLENNDIWDINHQKQFRDIQ